MSKIGQKPIIIGENVKAVIDKGNMLIEGPQGRLSIVVPPVLEVSITNKIILVKRRDELKTTKALHGLYRQLINNAVVGVEKPWQKRLEVVGTGYNVKLQGEELVFKLGYSHPVIFKKPPGIKFQVEGNNKVIVEGADKQLVGQVAYQIKMLKKPDVYKGKGIRYEGEKLRIKPGKKAKAAGASAV